MDSEAPTDTVSQTISEATFLVTELRYTLGQIHVQVGDLDESTRENATCGDRSVSSILREMQEAERRYQQRYSELLGASPQDLEGTATLPLPVNEEQDETSDEQNAFEHQRAVTIALLERAGDEWPDELLELVREHVTGDRRNTTDLAECRRAYFETDNRPDLDEPLTETEPEIVRSPEPRERSDRP